MALDNFGSVFFPYCLDRFPDGRYVVLNREYKPVGFKTEDLVDYSNFPVCVGIKGLGPRIGNRLSYDGTYNPERIYLYDDASNPFISKANMNVYLEKLSLLGKLQIANRVRAGV